MKLLNALLVWSSIFFSQLNVDAITLSNFSGDAVSQAKKSLRRGNPLSSAGGPGASLPGSMMAISPGHCMYNLPAKYNVDLQTATGMVQSPPQPLGATGGAFFDGLHDTNPFVLERLFYDRFLQEATEWHDPSTCRTFYVPYFASWESSSVNSSVKASQSQMDNEVANLLIHMGRKPFAQGLDHWMVLGRGFGQLGNIAEKSSPLAHIIKLTPEAHGGPYNMYSVPYPTWFRYDPQLEHKRSSGSIYVSAVTEASGTPPEACSAEHVGQFLAQRCYGKTYCGLAVQANSDLIPSCDLKTVQGTYNCGAKQAHFAADPDFQSQVLALGCGEGPCWLWNDCHKTAKDGPLVSFVGHANAMELDRALLIQMCKQRSKDCVHVETGNRGDWNFQSLQNKVQVFDSALLSSVFCLNPPGDTPTRKGLFDSLLAGCIPVVFDIVSVSSYTWHLPDWRAVSVFVSKEQLHTEGFNIVDHLASIPQVEVQFKQTAIKKLAYSLQYSSSPWTTNDPQDWVNRPDRQADAFRTTLNALLNMQMR